jgi:sugar transferase EpsL
MYRAFGKRALDVLVAGMALVILSPILLATAILIAARLGRPILFRQVRGGLDGRPFKVVKFRSMLDPVSSSGQALTEAERLTSVGRFLRESSLDELPGLWNVLRGDMSLVGPRPLIFDYMPLYTPHQRRRHESRPGITGWAQVNGRNSLTWEQRFELDVWYVQRVNLVLDLKIMMLTLKKVLLRDDINAAGEATMSRFQGSEPIAPALSATRAEEG